jgi:hypothetical protein
VTHVNLSRRAFEKLEKIKREIGGSASDAVLYLYEKYLFWLSEKRNGNSRAEYY